MVLAAVTLGEWLTAAGIIVGALAAAVVVGRLLSELLRRRSAGASLAIAFVVRLVRWATVLVGLVYAAGVVGVQIGPLVGALGITGLAVALALQPVLQNLFAGVVLHTERPIDRGEEVESMGYHGVVLDVTGRATVVQTFDGAIVHIPNAIVLDGSIANHTRNGARRSTVLVGVAYASDVARACSLLADTVAAVPGVQATPAPQAYAAEFGGSSIDIEVDYWHGPGEAGRRVLRSQVISAIHTALGDAGIVIPFPQRDVWMRTEEPDSAD